MGSAPQDEATEHTDGWPDEVLREPSMHSAVETMTDRIYQMLREVPMSETERCRMRFAVHEALSNAVKHGNHGDPSKLVTATCRREPGRVTVVVEDEGTGFDLDSVPDPTADENLLNETGRGILFMRAYADECRFEDGGRRVVLVKRFDPARAQTSAHL